MAEVASPRQEPTAPTASVEALLATVVARLDGLERRVNILIGLMGAVIVAMIGADGLLWNAIVTSERSLSQELVQLERRLDDRMAGLEGQTTALDGRMTALERSLGERITDLERRLVERIHNLELAFVRSGIQLRGGNVAPPQNQDERRSERDLAPGAGPAESEAPRPGAPQVPVE